MDLSSPAALKVLEQLGVSKLLSVVLDWQEQGGGDFSVFENEIRKRVSDLECEAMALGLSALDVVADELVIEGKRFRKRPKLSTREYTCRAGNFTIERRLYSPVDGGRSICPLELRAGIVEGAWTPVAAELMAHSATVMTPYEAEVLLAKFGGFTPSRSSLDRLPKALSARWEKNRWDWENILRSEETILPQATVASISLDGIKLPMADGDRLKKRQSALENGKEPRGPNGYREASCGTFTLYDDDGERLETIYYGRMPESKKPTLQEQLFAEASSYLQADPIETLVLQSDGAIDNWRILDSILDSLEEQGILSKTTQVYRIADFFHASEHLKKATDLYYGKNSAKSRTKWAELRTKLLEDDDGVDTIIRRLTYFRNRTSKRSSRRKRLTTELRYFRSRSDMMRYAEFVRKGLPIGTGITEAACETLVTQRMKRSGMRWTISGGQGVLTLRSLLQSKRWDSGWALLKESYREAISVVKRFRHLDLVETLPGAA